MTSIVDFDAGYRRRAITQDAIAGWVTAKLRNVEREVLMKQLRSAATRARVAINANHIMLSAEQLKRARANAADHLRWLTLVQADLNVRAAKAATTTRRFGLRAKRVSRLRVGLLAREAAIFAAPVSDERPDP